MRARPSARGAALAVLPALVLLPAGAEAQATAPSAPPPAAEQIAAAVLALPEELRGGAGVLGYDQDGRLTEHRAAANEMLCLADDPNDGRFHVACYHRDLEPFMKRGRELRDAGADPERVTRTRLEEIVAGELAMPLRPTALYSLTGPAGAFDPATGSAPGAVPLFVLYIPWATEGSTGLSIRPRPGEPWLMDPDTPWAHVMYFPAPPPSEEDPASDGGDDDLARPPGAP